MTVAVYQQHTGPFDRVLDWEYQIDIDHWGEPCSAALYVNGVCIDGEVDRDEYMRVWAAHQRHEAALAGEPA
jgi:hypothetical protein